MKISIITATYNSSATICDTLESVLAQKYEHIEHIIKDGGSRDNTLDLVESFRSRYEAAGKSLIVVSEKDNGLYDAMNKGLALTSGDVIGILNSDDFFTSENIISTVVEKIGEYDAVYGDVHYVNGDDLGKCVRYYSLKSFRRWKMRMGYMPAHPSFYCRKEIYERYGMFDTTFQVAADFEQLLRFIFITRIIVKYRPVDFVTMRTGGASTSGLQSHKKIFADHLKAYKKNDVYSNFFLEGIRYADRMIEKLTRKIFH